MTKSGRRISETWMRADVVRKSQLAYLSAEHAQGLAERRRVSGYDSGPAFRVRTTPEGLWRVQFAGREQLMPPMGLDDWSAWVEHFVG